MGIITYHKFIIYHKINNFSNSCSTFLLDYSRGLFSHYQPTCCTPQTSLTIWLSNQFENPWHIIIRNNVRVMSYIDTFFYNLLRWKIMIGLIYQFCCHRVNFHGKTHIFTDTWYFSWPITTQKEKECARRIFSVQNFYADSNFSKYQFSQIISLISCEITCEQVCC